MTDEPHPIWASMERAIDAAPSDRESLFPPDWLPRPLSPWAFWSLIALVRHRARQHWALAIVRDRLGIPLADMVGEKKWRVERRGGVVPGLIEWSYKLRVSVVQLTHRLTGEVIRAMVYEETGETFFPGYCGGYIASLRAPEPPERRLRELHPSIWTMCLAQRELQRAGLLLPSPHSDGVFVLPPQVVDRAELVSAFCQAWCDDARRPGAALAVGDWMAAARLMPDASADLRGRIHAEMQDCQLRRVRMLMNRIASKKWGGEALIAFAEVDPRWGSLVIGEVLAGCRRLSLIYTALDMIVEADNASWCPSVGRLFKRLDPNRSEMQAICWRICAEILLRHGYRKREVLKRLSRARRFEVSDAAFLALKYDPPRAPPLFRRALSLKDMPDRGNAAAVLAILDEDWSRRLMLETMNESGDVDAAIECCCALSFSRDPSARRAAEQWERAFESGSLRGIPVSVRREDADEMMRDRMAACHNTVLALRGRIP
jgi:hypothetical protein